MTKLLRAISGSPERTDWESLLTQVGGDNSAWGDLDAMRTSNFASKGFAAALDTDAPDVNLALLGLSGEEIHTRAKSIAKELHALAERGATVQEWNLLIRDVTALSAMGQTINSLAEVKLRRVEPKVQRVPMLQLMGSILAKRANDLRRSGVILEPQLQSCTIEGDPHLCRALIETAIEWALPFGNRMTVTTELSSWGDAARLTIMADHVVRTQDDTPPMERTSIFLWELISELAQAAGVVAGRSQVDGKTAISIEFPIQNDNLSGHASDEVQLQSMEAPTLSQMDVLVYVTSPHSSAAIDKTLSREQCRVRLAASLAQLVRECERVMPAALVMEADLLDENAKSLVDDLRRHMRNFVMIEIITAPNVYEVSQPGTKSSCRLSAANIEAHLRDALMFEVAQRPPSMSSSFQPLG